MSRYARLVWLAGAMVAALTVASSDDRAEAYLLLDGGALDYIVPASEAIRWSADVWGPGQTLVWEIEDGPDWELLLGGPEDFVPVVEEALAIWSAIETADISWRLAGVVEATEGPHVPDARSRVSFEATNVHPLWGAELWWRRNRRNSTWEITECNVGLLDPLSLREDEESTDDDLRRHTVSFLVEEFGHCLGLGTSSPLPGSILRIVPSGVRQAWRGTEVWQWPVMGQGWGTRLTSDDRIGASLLRPRDGWISRTARIAGRLESDGRPVRYAHVFALRLEEDRLRDPVGAFANADGEFLIEEMPGGGEDVTRAARFLQRKHSAEFPDLLASDAPEVFRAAGARGLIPEAAAERLAEAAVLWKTLGGILQVVGEGAFEAETATDEVKAVVARAAGADDFGALTRRIGEVAAGITRDIRAIDPTLAATLPSSASGGRSEAVSESGGLH